MKKEDRMGFKLVGAVLMVALALGGPLAPLAWAQEKMDAQMVPAKEREGLGLWWLGAAAATAVNVPGKAVLCTLGAATGLAVLVVSFGSGYQWSGRVWEEGCGGKWIITAADVKGEPPEPEFWSDQPEYQSRSQK